MYISMCIFYVQACKYMYLSLFILSEKTEYVATIESLQNELSGMRLKCEEVEQAKADAEDQVFSTTSMLPLLIILKQGYNSCKSL